MRLGGPIHANNPEDWVKKHQTAGYRAAYCPVDASADRETIRAYQQAAAEADIVIAEVGIWNNPLAQDEAERKAALEKCEQQLALADEIGALCCVNLSGSRGEQWDGPHPNNYMQETFDLIVETVRNIVDTVKPTRTFYTLETMPWLYPDSVDSYLDLINAIDRSAFGVHLDPVNLITSPYLYFNNGVLIADAFDQLGDHIKSCHIKDITLEPNLAVHFQEVRPGLGNLDYWALLTHAHALDVPIMLEHLPTEDYPSAADYVRAVAQALAIQL